MAKDDEGLVVKIDQSQLTLDPAPFRLAEAVEDVATLISARVAEKNLELIVRVDPTLPAFVVGDAGRFRQIITNLLGNAVKFTEKGHVLVDVSGEIVDGIVRMKVKIEDTGIGIEEATLRNIRARMYADADSAPSPRNGDAAKPNTGSYGLLNVHRRLRLHYGSESGLTIDSQAGRGTRISFLIPLKEGQQP